MSAHSQRPNSDKCPVCLPGRVNKWYEDQNVRGLMGLVINRTGFTPRIHDHASGNVTVEWYWCPQAVVYTRIDHAPKAQEALEKIAEFLDDWDDRDKSPDKGSTNDP